MIEEMQLRDGVSTVGPDDYARVSFLQSETEQQAIAHDLTLVAG